MPAGNNQALRRILIIDDDADYRALLHGFLGGTFPDVEVEEFDPAGGLPPQDFDWSRHDMLILDYNLQLQDVTGLDVLPANQQREDFPATIMLTGAGDEDVAVRAFKSGVQDYLRKQDLKKSQLRDSILYALQKRELQRQQLHALEEVRKMARSDSTRAETEFKAAFEQIRTREETRLKQERARMQNELQDRERTLQNARREKTAAADAARSASAQVVALHGKSTKDASVPDVKRDMVAARARLERHNARLVQARLEHEKAETELLKSQWKLEQEEAMRKRMQDDLASFNEELREQEENQSRASAEQQRKRDIKARNEAQKKVVDKVHNQELIRDVSDQLKE